jgi:YHS domain-containing protein
MLTGDSKTTARGGGAKLGIDEVIAEVLPDQKADHVRASRPRAASSRWPATASTTPPRWPRRRSASRWAPAPTSRWRAPGSRWSRATCAASCARGALSRDDGNIKQNLFFAFVYNAAGVPIAAGVLYPFFGLLLLSPMHRRRGDEPQLGLGDRQRAAAAVRANIAARVAALARAGEIVCTEAVAAVAVARALAPARPMGTVRLKNVSMPLALFELGTGAPTGRLHHLDPVCRMQIDPATAATTLAQDGVLLYFCSAGCRARFEAAPEAYLLEPAGTPG